MEIRLARPDDAAAVREIYAPYIINTAVSFEYNVPSVEEMRQRISSTLEKYPYLVAEENGQIIGYAYANKYHPRAAYSHTAELSIYIDAEHRRSGLGRKLYTELEDILKKQNIFILYTLIAHTDLENDPYLTNASIIFHERMGYTLVGKNNLCGYKFNRWYSIVLMEKVIRERPEFPEEFIPFPLLEK